MDHMSIFISIVATYFLFDEVSVVVLTASFGTGVAILQLTSHMQAIHLYHAAPTLILKSSSYIYLHYLSSAKYFCARGKDLGGGRSDAHMSFMVLPSPWFFHLYLL